MSATYEFDKTLRAIRRPRDDKGVEYVTKVRGQLVTQAQLDEMLDERMPREVKHALRKEALRNWIDPDADVDTSTWRIRARTAARSSFTDEKKGRWLFELSKHGQYGLADAAVGVSCTTRRAHLENDEAFAQAEEEVMACYSGLQVRMLEAQAMEGELHISYDKEGNKVGERRVFETPLRLAILRRHDKRFGEKQEIEHTFKGGVLLMPAAVAPSQWEAEAAKVTGRAEQVLPPGDPLKLEAPNVLEADWEEKVADESGHGGVRVPAEAAGGLDEGTVAPVDDGGLHEPAQPAGPDATEE
jgi:hypothetical protein